MRSNRFKKILVAAIAAITVIAVFPACMASGPNGGGGWDYIESAPGEIVPGEEYDKLVEKGFVNASVQPDSTFSLDANTAAYSIMRARIEAGNTLDVDSVRIEEYINYFNYDSYPAPEDGKAVKLNYSVFDSPWSENKLLRIGLKTQEIEMSDVYNNIVFLVDVSGSMSGRDRIGLAKYGFQMIARGLNAHDTVSIVTYASGTSVKLDGAKGSDTSKIERAIERLSAGGSTAGSKGIQEAYRLAEKHFIEGGNNRVILATDGDFNVGISDPDRLKEFIAEKRDTGVYLSVFGFGMGNTKDKTMEALAKNGNGTYAYVDSQIEVQRMMVDGLSATIKTVARDAKAKVEFNPDTVAKYRLIGYENKRISVADYDDPDKDTGEIGSGLTVTALYEIVPTSETLSGNLGIASVKYKSADDPSSTEDFESRLALSSAKYGQPNEDDAFIGCVAEFGLVLRNSAYRENASLASVMRRLADFPSSDVYRAEFAELVGKADRLYSSYERS